MESPVPNPHAAPQLSSRSIFVIFAIGEINRIVAASSDKSDGAATAAALQSAAHEQEREQQAAAEMTEAKEKLRLLQLQSLKYSTIWLLVRVSHLLCLKIQMLDSLLDSSSSLTPLSSS